MGTPRDLKVQMAAETRARERAQSLAKLQTIRADRAEAALIAARAEGDAWQARALGAEADLAALRGEAKSSAPPDDAPEAGTGAGPSGGISG